MLKILPPPTSTVVPIGIGYYTVPEAARLVGMPARNIRRWLGGYSFNDRAGAHTMPPLWTPEIPPLSDHIELSFRDLIELRFVHAFTQAGIGLNSIRTCLEFARKAVDNDRPFSTRRFRTDGHSIFLESHRTNGDVQLLDLQKKQYALPDIIERSFKDLDIADDAVVRWRPYKGRETIVVDPARAFGQPIATRAGIPTATLYDALRAEGSVKRVAYLYEVETPVIKDAEKFQLQLMAA